MSRYSGILAMGKKNYPSLVFDFSELGNVADYYQEYSIPAEEKPVVYAYSGQFFSFRLEGRGTLITDEAIYFHPSHKDWARTNRLPLSEICSYVVYQENKRDHVSLISGHGERKVFGRTVAPNDNTGAELVELLKALQAALICGSKEKKEFERTLMAVLALIRESFKDNGIICGKYRILLDQIAEYPGFATEVAFIRAEHYYRLCNEEEYYRYVAGLGDEVDERVRESLKKPDMLFFDRYINQIANAQAFYMTKSLIEPYLNLKRKERLSLRECQLLCFLCIRLEDEDYYHIIYDMIKSHLNADDFWNLSSFGARYYNEKMSGVYDSFLSGKTLSEQEFLFRDALGLSPLHYALIMRNKELVRELLYACDWSSFKPPETNSGKARAAYDFVFVAANLFDDVKLVSEIIMRTEAKARPLSRTLRQLNNSIEIHSKLLQKAVHSANVSDMGFHKKQIEEYSKLREEVEEEIQRLTMGEMKDARRYAEALLNSKEPLPCYLLDLYLSPDGLYRSIADTIHSWRLYKAGDLYFIAPPGQDLDLSYYEWSNGKIVARNIIESEIKKTSETDRDSYSEYFDGDTFINPERMREEQRAREEDQRRREEERQRKRSRFKQFVAASEGDMAYGNSFFSPQAHRNLQILKQEYRKLVKRYHPDSGGDARDVEIMLMVMNERADILEKMEK